MPELLLPFITVVVPVRNELHYIGKTLGRLLAQDYPAGRFEIVVADGMSDDGTADRVHEITRTDPRVRLVMNTARLSGAGRNIGFREGKGELFVVVDGHCFIPDNRLLMNVAKCFSKSGADCLGRPQPLDPPGLTDFQRAVAVARGSWLGHGGDSIVYNQFEGFASPVSNGAAYRRSVFEKVGYVDETFDACEDVEFNYRVERVGLKCYTSPSLTVRYYPRGSLAGLFRQMARYGRGRFRFVRKHPRAFTVNQIVPALFVLGLTLLFPLSIAASFGWASSRILALIGWAVVMAYILVVLLQGLRLASVSGARLYRHVILVFPVVHLGLGLGFLFETCRVLASVTGERSSNVRA